MTSESKYFSASFIVLTLSALASCSGQPQHERDAGPDSGSDDASPDTDSAHTEQDRVRERERGLERKWDVMG